MLQGATFYRSDLDYLNDTYLVRRDCVECRIKQETTIKAPDLFRYRQGAFAQDAFPYLSPAEREMFFISGVCGSCFNKLIGGGE